MKTKSLLLLFLVSLQSLFAQEIVGSWEGDLSVQGTKLPLIFNIQKNGEFYLSTLDSPMQGAKGIPVKETIYVNNELKINAPNLNLKFEGLFKGETIDGTFIQNGASFPLILNRKKGDAPVLNRPQEPKPPFDYPIEEVIFVNPKDKNTLAGTLALPKNKKDFPVVVLITGSGAQNRDSEIFGHKPFAVIANDFAQKGIGVLRLDDRGVGGSSKGTTEDTSANFATDISAAVDFLSAKGFGKIGLIGHSEGGLIAPIVAVQNKKVQFIISLAGPGIPIDQMMLLQSQAIAKSQGATPAQIEASTAFNQKVYAYIINYKGADLKTDFQPFVKEEFKKITQSQGLSESQIDNFVAQQTQNITSSWYVYFIKFNPDLYWSKLKIPVLALNGSLDVQVKATENLAGIQASLAKAGNKKVAIKELPGLNHLFQEAKTGATAEYLTIEQTFAPTALNTMSDWILGLK
ncbi:alpha/beta hydrolase [Flavobacterium alvei]|uniref:Alpha/beta hydrolase n=1 Tax=Flavobacterium alvei TaxID=2080416 RepID=A0A2S5ACF7_9FLAO|nr:alpha/beta hydrolase [Flavobacterium alvei]POY39927.1 alpha/beta hydrolase [Flavobacterium alvei]